MKKYLAFIIALTCLVILIGCSEESPGVRVYNERSTKANVQIKSSNGNTINLNDVEPGQTTNYQNISEGRSQATAVIQSESVSPTTSFNTANDYNYTVVVTNTNPPTLSVESHSK